jgi:signal transduction histidine kinase
MISLRSRLFVATLAALVLTLTLTTGIDAVLTRGQVAAAQARVLKSTADTLYQQRRSTVSYIDVPLTPIPGGVEEQIEPRSAFAGLVPDPNVASNGTVTLVGKQYLYAYHTLPSRGLLLLLLRAQVDWWPFLRILLLSALAGIVLAAALAYGLAGSIVRPIRRVAAASNSLAAGETTTTLPEEGSRELASLARSFNEMNEQLAVSRASERAFLLSVSHEFKTPLTAIRGYAEGLAEGAFSGEETARIILVESRRLERLVHDILDLARMHRDEFAVRQEVVDLADVAREAVARHEATARGFGVRLAAEGDEALVKADYDRVLQVASNLVENALRETPKEGAVTVHSAAGALTVSDSGPGLASDDLPRAFDRFFLYDKYGRERPVGSGLGLAIVKQLSEAMGGSVTARSVPGEGASFTVHLPVSAAPAAREQRESVEA